MPEYIGLPCDMPKRINDSMNYQSPKKKVAADKQKSSNVYKN